MGKYMENSLYMEVYSWDMLGQSSMKHNDGFSSKPCYQRVLHVFANPNPPGF
jgi:hypothetical protein